MDRRASLSTRKTAVGLAMEGVLPDPLRPLGPPPAACSPPPLPPGVTDGLFVQEDEALPRGSSPSLEPHAMADTLAAVPGPAAPGQSLLSHSPAAATARTVTPAASTAVEEDIEAQLSEVERAAPGTELAAMARAVPAVAVDADEASTAPSRRPWWRRWGR
jgi:hypothetical protein